MAGAGSLGDRQGPAQVVRRILQPAQQALGDAEQHQRVTQGGIGGPEGGLLRRERGLAVGDRRVVVARLRLDDPEVDLELDRLGPGDLVRPDDRQRPLHPRARRVEVAPPQVDHPEHGQRLDHLRRGVAGPA